jgi:hypothetical protein
MRAARIIFAMTDSPPRAFVVKCNNTAGAPSMDAVETLRTDGTRERHWRN